MVSLVDSSVWVALYLEKDTQHEQAAALVPRLTGRLYLTYGVLEETTSILTYKHSREQAERFLTFVESNQRMTYLEPDWLVDIDAFRSVDSRISFVDTALLALSRRLDCTLVTFDVQLARLARKQSR